MSKMDSFPSARQSVSARWVLLMLISCLVLHFLVEDSLLLNDSAAINIEFSEQLGYEEATHVDDLAAPIHLPERITNIDVPAAFSLIVPLRKQANSPIFPPPKIATA